jgi:integrase
MQRILSAYSKQGRPPFSLRGLRIPERDKLEMKIHSRKKVSYSWRQAVQIAERIRNMSGLLERERHAVMVLVDAAWGLRPGELLALRLNGVGFTASTIRVDEMLPRKGEIGPCKNAAAYRTVLVRDVEGKRAVQELKRFRKELCFRYLLFHTKRCGPIQETLSNPNCADRFSRAIRGH